MTFRGLIPWVIVSAAFAGCVSGGAEGNPAGASGEPSSGPALFDETTGGIEGTVTDPELVPVANATVGLVQGDSIPSEISTTTDASGRFSLSHVPPGQHTLSASAVGYEAGGVNVNVNAGEVASVSLVLGVMPSDAPYFRVFTAKVTLSGILYKATPSCIYTDIDPLIKTCGGVRLNELKPGGVTIVAGCPACETHTLDKMPEFAPEWETIVAELQWKPQSGASGRGFSFDVNAPNITRGASGSINQADPKTWQKQTGKSPIIIRIDKNITLAERKINEYDWNNFADQQACTAPAPRNSNGQKTSANCDWFFRVFPAACDLNICPEGTGPDYGIMYEGSGEVFFSYFVREPAPQGYTGLPEG